jgi:hypothetical protein
MRVMSLTPAQLDQLDRELDHNHREMVVLPMSVVTAPSANASSFSVPARAPQVCTRPYPGLMNVLWREARADYNATVHAFVNTPWGVPVALAGYDLYNINRLLRDIGGFGTKVRISTVKGKQYLILTGHPGLRNRLKGTRYALRNPQLIEMGIGKYGVRGSSISGFKLSCYVGVGVEVLEWIFNDEAVMTDLFAGIGVELIKAGIASAVGYAGAVAFGAMTGFAAAPVFAGAVIVFLIGGGLNIADNYYGLKDSVKAGMRYATANSEKLICRLSKIDFSEIQAYLKEKILSISKEIAESQYEDPKYRILRRIDTQRHDSTDRPTVPKLLETSRLKYPGI